MLSPIHAAQQKQDMRHANKGVGTLAEGAAFPAAGVIVLPAKTEVTKKFYPGDKLCIA